MRKIVLIEKNNKNFAKKVDFSALLLCIVAKNMVMLRSVSHQIGEKIE